MHDRLAMYDSLQCSFLRIKKPPKQKKCPVCGPAATIKSMEDSQNASEAARGPSCSIGNGRETSPSLPECSVASCSEYAKVRNEGEPHVLLDVRVREQFEICSLEGAINMPLESLKDNLHVVAELSEGTKPVYCLCRRGIASVAATSILNLAAATHPNLHSVKNIDGGLDAWRKEVDSSFPKY
jgi:adenylyltransferase/sulfurtransferase